MLKGLDIGWQVPTLPIDIALDVFFLLDILVNFNMATMGSGDAMLEFNDDRWQVPACLSACSVRHLRTGLIRSGL